jgi:hypothetical protein
MTQAIHHLGATVSDARDKAETGDDNPFFQST